MWPLLYSQVLKVKDTKNPVGVVTMWTERNVVEKLLERQNYCAIGNLYSAAGISPMIRNIYANPTIRYIILWGADLSSSGQSLISFMENGIDKNHKIIGDQKKGEIEKEISVKYLDLFRKNVKVINLRGRSPDELKNTIKTFAKEKVKPFSEELTFSRTKPKYQTFPSEQVGFRVSGKKVATVWLKILNNIMRYGREKKTRYAKDNELRELLNIMAVVEAENIDKPYLAHYFPFSESDLLKYYPQVLSAKKIPGISYTYGQRLRDHDGIDQIGEIVKLIKRRPFSKKMAAFTPNIKKDWARNNIDRGDTPCLTQVLCSIQDNKLVMTAHFRSQDMAHGWPRNMFSLIKMQEMIARETGYKRGKFCMITHSAHIYADDYQLVEKIIDQYYLKELGYTPQQHFEEDPRGNAIVELANQERKQGRPGGKSPFKPGSGEIVLNLYAPKGGLLLKSWKGQTAMQVYLQLTDWDFLVMPSHLIYVGTELQRAEYALKNGFDYSQDPGPNKMI